MSNPRICFQITPSGWGDLQLNICGHDHEGRGLRYALRGARSTGQADVCGEQVVTQQDADTIRHFLDMAFPPVEMGDAS